jgi:hypothetical protein
MTLSLATVIEDMVEQYRLGDQNAGSLLHEVGRQVRTGSASDHVRKNYTLILRYIEKHPYEPENETSFGEESYLVRLNRFRSGGPVSGFCVDMAWELRE